MAIRTFIALPLAPEIIAMLGRIQQRMRHYPLNISWVHPQNIHLTLRFLGDIQQSEVASIKEAVYATAAQYAPITLITRGVGVFPGIRQPRVLWAGIQGKQLFQLQETLSKQLARIGFPFEKRQFKGHLTIGRIKTGVDARLLVQALAAEGGFASMPFRADKIILYKSDLKPTGAVYTAMISAALPRTING